MFSPARGNAGRGEILKAQGMDAAANARSRLVV
jgi:hypothetical protein